jgi:hypothetical protein
MKKIILSGSVKKVLKTLKNMTEWKTLGEFMSFQNEVANG